MLWKEFLDTCNKFFCRTKLETQDIADKLIKDGYNAEALHGDLSQQQRDLTMQKFRKKVVPGDTLLFRVELLAPVRHGISSMKGYMFVGDQVVAEATFTAQIVKNK